MCDYNVPNDSCTRLIMDKIKEFDHWNDLCEYFTEDDDCYMRFVVHEGYLRLRFRDYRWRRIYLKMAKDNTFRKKVLNE